MSSRQWQHVKYQKRTAENNSGLTFLNPKSIIFFASFMPQFIVKENSYITNHNIGYNIFNDRFN